MGKQKKKPPCPNPLFVVWLEGWRDEARDKGSKLQHAYGKALASIHKYPLPLQSGQEAMILEGIGESIAKKLDKALELHKSSNEIGNNELQNNSIPTVQDTRLVNYHGNTMSHGTVPLPSLSNPCDDGGGQQTRAQPKKKKAAGPKEYVPGYRTGPYALLLTLYEDSKQQGNRGYMTKNELQRQAQSMCDKSFTLPDPGSRYTAWSSMSILTKKGFVTKFNNPAKYSITADGCNLAAKLQTVSPSSSQSADTFTVSGQASSSADSGAQSESVCDDGIGPFDSCLNTQQEKPTQPTYTSVMERTSTQETQASSTQYSPILSNDFTPEFTLKPGSFDIVLCVDFIETTGGSHGSRKDALLPELQNNGVNFDVRKLQVGDFLWVAREKTQPLPGQLSKPAARELVLDYIVERKRMDDLNSSIIDGRFHEQKFRLRNCGLRHPVYLVEDFGSAQHLSLPEATLKQAIVNTQVIDGFFVKRTRDLKESVAYLTLMTRFLQSFYSDKTLIATPGEKLEQIASRSVSGDIMAREINLVSFAEFSKETVKNKVITVAEMFGKQLMQISGMSADKATVILEKYPTPRSLLKAYENQSGTPQKEAMLSSFRYGKAQRNFGPTLSNIVYKLYCTKDPLV